MPSVVKRRRLPKPAFIANFDRNYARYAVVSCVVVKSGPTDCYNFRAAFVYRIDAEAYSKTDPLLRVVRIGA